MRDGERNMAFLQQTFDVVAFSGTYIAVDISNYIAYES
jgi:hypothetical protein